MWLVIVVPTTRRRICKFNPLRLFLPFHMTIAKDDVCSLLVKIAGGKRNWRCRNRPDEADQTVLPAVTVAVANSNHVRWFNNPIFRDINFQPKTVSVANGRRSATVVSVTETCGVGINVEWKRIAKPRWCFRLGEFQSPRWAAEDGGVAGRMP